MWVKQLRSKTNRVCLGGGVDGTTKGGKCERINQGINDLGRNIVRVKCLVISTFNCRAGGRVFVPPVRHTFPLDFL